MALGGSVECRRKFIFELNLYLFGAFKVFLGHTAYMLWVTIHAFSSDSHIAYSLLVTIHMFCSHSHTARPSDVYSSTFGFVIRFASLQFDSCVTFPAACFKMWILNFTVWILI